MGPLICGFFFLKSELLCDSLWIQRTDSKVTHRFDCIEGQKP